MKRDFDSPTTFSGAAAPPPPQIRLTKFEIEKIVVQVPATPDLFCVTIEATQAARCSCQHFKTRRSCHHTAQASAFLFSTEGLTQTYNAVLAKLAAIDASPAKLTMYQVGAWNGIRREIEQRLNIPSWEECDLEPRKLMPHSQWRRPCVAELDEDFEWSDVVVASPVVHQLGSVQAGVLM